jgi:hypothetical protein
MKVTFLSVASADFAFSAFFFMGGLQCVGVWNLFPQFEQTAIRLGNFVQKFSLRCVLLHHLQCNLATFDVSSYLLHSQFFL